MYIVLSTVTVIVFIHMLPLALAIELILQLSQ